MKRYHPVDAKGITTKFGRKFVHKDLNFHAEEGKITGTVGGSGSGKSVLMNTMLGLIEPQCGEIFFNGLSRKKLKRNDIRELNNSIGVLFQGGALFSSLTILDNILVPLREYTNLSEQLLRGIASMKIQMVGLTSESLDLYPSELSGGMRKRAGLARALALDPKLLFLDEPTAGLDPIAAHAFDELILSLKTSMDLTVVMVTHDLDSLLNTCDKVAVLINKQIAIIDSLHKVAQYDNPWVKEYFNGPRSRFN
ncbi:MAG: ATP-binding cassette domain-containing protein [Hellea sp.]|nr:ATP-binding cassette domain-containing protein [Hellea sp.]